MRFVFMPVYEPHYDTPLLKARLLSQQGLSIACYCAAWCDTCTKYRADFNALAEKWPQHTFVWIDIEENPDLLDDEDVENFPTILIQSQEGNAFFGTLLPYISHLDRLIENIDEATTFKPDGPRQLSELLASAAQ